MFLASSLRAETPPNIVFFFADDQTTSTLGCYGNEVVQTPNIDSLATRGTRFAESFVSHPICWISRTTILTGLTGRSFSTPDNPEQATPEAVGNLYPDILRANGIKVITHTRFETLFTMLAGGRFDCFARGVSEVLYDLDSLHDHQLAIEPNLLLAYPMPSYFFVGPDDHDTAQRVQLGLERAIEDGSFARFLSDYYGRAVDSLNLDRRQILILNHPFLSSDSEQIAELEARFPRD